MEVCVTVGILSSTVKHTTTHILPPPTRTHHTGTLSNLVQEGTDVFKQELNVAETDTSFNCNNTQVILSLY